MSETPKPTPLLVVTSALVIAFSLFLVSVAMAAFTATWDLCSLMGGAIILPLPAALAVQQYRGTFRRVGSAASASATLLFVIGGIAAFTFAVPIAESAADGRELPWFGFMLPTLATSMIAVFAGVLNWRWYLTLPDTAAIDSRWRFSIRETMAAVAAVCFSTALTSSFIRSTPPRYAENVPVSEAPLGLPPNATDVSFCQGFRGTIAFEFSIDEASFREWVADGIGSMESRASNTKLEPITTPESITRYSWLSPELHGPDSVAVTSGLHYSWSFEDRGVYAMFDSDTRRAYYYAHFY